MKETPEATLARLQRVLKYMPRKGCFVWLVRRQSHGRVIQPGDIAGTRAAERVQIGVDGKLYRVHRLAFLFMTGKWPAAEVDHDNGVEWDNRWCNIRGATKAQNMWNVRKLSPTNKSGKRGVSWDAHCNKWLVRITVNGRLFELGMFPREELSKAIEVRRTAELKHYGKYAPKEFALTAKSEAEIAALPDGRGAPKLDRRNKSGKQGVSWSSTYQKWESTLHLNGKQVYLGSFPIDRLDAAIEARRAGELKYWGKLCPK